VKSVDNISTNLQSLSIGQFPFLSIIRSDFEIYCGPVNNNFGVSSGRMAYAVIIGINDNDERAQMKELNIEFAVNIEEQKQTEYILSLPIWISCTAYLVALLSAIYTHDWALALVTLTGIIILSIPYWLLKRGRFLSSAYASVFMVLVTITSIATVGQGIHDVAIMAYPIIIIFASLALNRSGFRISVGLTLIAMGWLVFGDSWGLYIPQPYIKPTWVDYLVISAILFSAVGAVDILATMMRNNLRQAKQEIVQRKVIEEQLRFQSTHDSMTGIFNRNFFETELARLELSRDFPISIVIADVDGLKIINDTLGHSAGDKKLKQTADVLRSILRSEDILARIGGDEFAAILPKTDSIAVQYILSRIKARLVEHNAKHSDLQLQLSLGAATSESSGLTNTFKLADQIMYADKSMRKSNESQFQGS
jgi:diguanylate cyclase (GGDEF)-like protein